MPDYDERAELAPRDVVARAIDHEIKRDRPRLCPSRHQPPRRRVREGAFPQHLREAARRSASTSPTSRSRSSRPQHYTCGGVVIDLDGRTDLPGLYAAGEVHPVGPARRQPPRLQLAARMPRVRRGGGEAHIAAHWDELPAPPRDPRLGRKPGHRFATRKSSSSRTGPRSAASCGIIVGIVRTTKRLERAAAPHRAAERRGRRLLRPFPRDARPDRAAQPARESPT